MDEAEHLHWSMHAHLLTLARVAGGRVEHRPGYDLVVIPAVPVPDLNAVYVLRPEDDLVASRGLADAIAEIESLGVPAAVGVCPGWSPLVEAEAHRLGLTAGDVEPGMVVGPSELMSVEVDGFEVVLAEGPDLALAGRVAEEGFGIPAGILAPIYRPEVVASGGMRVYLAIADGVPVSTATGLTLDGLAGIYTVATPEAHRGKGYGAAVSARAALDGFAGGAVLAGLKASEMGERVYRRLGFRAVRDYLMLTRPQGPP